MVRKKKVEQNRSRYRTVAFRMSENELAELETRISLSGRDKQDYLIKSVLYQTIVVVGNKVQFEALENQLCEIAEYLKGLESATAFDPAMLLPIRTAVEIIDGFTNAEKPWDDTGMTRAPESSEIREKSDMSEIQNRWSRAYRRDDMLSVEEWE
jgi:hypothetical protein